MILDEELRARIRRAIHAEYRDVGDAHGEDRLCDAIIDIIADALPEPVARVHQGRDTHPVGEKG